MSEITIRPATPTDVPAVLALWRSLQAENASHEPALKSNATAAEWFGDYLRDVLGHGDHAVFVAVADASVIGYVYGQILRRPTLASGDCGYIADIYIRREFQGQGCGRALFQQLRAWFRMQGVCSLEVQVVRANPAAQAFWRKMGFGEFLRTLRAET